ncbi:hypothetical protein AC249_AIPGENE6424 [Exaiptasia diaphana]|nr:hypothetical protein AC249_AIPGENE6424 [Exaiptasia diaphana]
MSSQPPPAEQRQRVLAPQDALDGAKQQTLPPPPKMFVNHQLVNLQHVVNKNHRIEQASVLGPVVAEQAELAKPQMEENEMNEYSAAPTRS